MNLKAILAEAKDMNKAAGTNLILLTVIHILLVVFSYFTCMLIFRTVLVATLMALLVFCLFALLLREKIDPPFGLTAEDIFHAGSRVTGIFAVVLLYLRVAYIRTVVKVHRNERAGFLSLLSADRYTLKYMLLLLVCTALGTVSVRFVFALFVLCDDNSASILDALRRSCELASAHRHDLWAMRFKLLPYTLFGVLLFAIPMIYVNPLRLNCWVLMYDNIRREGNECRYCSG